MGTIENIICEIKTAQCILQSVLKILGNERLLVSMEGREESEMGRQSGAEASVLVFERQIW